MKPRNPFLRGTELFKARFLAGFDLKRLIIPGRPWGGGASRTDYVLIITLDRADILGV